MEANWATPKVLEVGSGDGRLGAYLEEEAKSLTIISTDNGENGLQETSPYRRAPFMLQVACRGMCSSKNLMKVMCRERVQMMDCQSALTMYQPDVVLCSWMPFGKDWTHDMRACASVSAHGMMFRLAAPVPCMTTSSAFQQGSCTCAGERVHPHWGGGRRHLWRSRGNVGTALAGLRPARLRWCL